MRITYDAAAHALYISLSAEAVAATRQVSDAVLIDVDVRGHEVGIEILNVTGVPTVERIDHPRATGGSDA